MTYGLWLSAAGLQVNQHKQAVIANNLANLGTTGFKRDLAIFRERRVESESGAGAAGSRHQLLDGLTGGTWQNPTATDFSQAALEKGGPLDVAIEGDGFFKVQVGDQIRYTRDGRFTLDASGDLVTVAGGHPVMDQADQPLRIGRVTPNRITIASTGRIQVGEQQVGTLGVTDFADRSLLVKAGENTFDGRHAEPVEATGTVVQGHSETSGVEPTTELIGMIESARAYQLNAMLISLQDGMLGRVVNDVGRVA